MPHTLFRVFATIAAIACVASNPTDVLAKPWNLLFASSFDQGLDAEFADGSPVAHAHHDLAASPDGRSGGGLRIAPNTWLRYTLGDNIDFDLGTLSVWARPDFAPAEGGEARGDNIQYVFAMGVRTGHRLQCWFDMTADAPRLRLRVGNAEDNHVVGIPIDDWGAGEWRRIQVSWRAPGHLAFRVGDDAWEERQDMPLPDLPSAMFYDVYFGTNAVEAERMRLGRPKRFHGVLDDVRIYRAYKHQTHGEPIAVESAAIPGDVAALDPVWVSENRYRLMLYLDDNEGDWDRRPVSVMIEPTHGWADLDAAGRRAALDSMRLVRVMMDGEAMPADGEPYVAFVPADEAYWSDRFEVRFTHEGDLPAVYCLYYDPAAPHAEPAPKAVPMVGNGDRLRIGSRDSLAPVAGALRGSFDVFDPDSDGDLDVWMSYGLHRRRNSDLPNGHYYYERVTEDGVTHLAPPTRILQASTPKGFLRPQSAPQVVDVDGDGRLDLCLYRDKSPQWIEWRMERGFVTPTAYHRMNTEIDKRGERGRLIDWDDDGRLDLLLGRRVYLNQAASADQPPRFDDDHMQRLQVDSVQQADWDSSPLGVFPVDWDGDGTRDLLASNWQTRLFLHRGVPGQPFAFESGERLETFDGHELFMPSVFPYPVVADWDGDGDHDLIWTNDGSSLGWCENIAAPGEAPKLRQTSFILQRRPYVSAGALSIPTVSDWDQDGDIDLILGGAGELIYLVENIGRRGSPVWAQPEPMQAAGARIELRAGPEGSLAGDQESDWGYLNPTVADWNRDGLPDLLVSGVRGEVHLFENVGEPGRPQLATGRLLRVDWGDGERATPAWIRFKPRGDELLVAPRSRPQVVDWNEDGVNDLLMLDHDDRWAVYLGRETANGEIVLEPGRRNVMDFHAPFSEALVWNHPPRDADGWRHHYAGRTVIQLIDWDDDGDDDLVMDNVNARLFENVGRRAGRPQFVDRGDLAPDRLTNHNSGPIVTDMDDDGRLDLLVGTESGHVFYYHRAFIEGQAPRATVVADQRRQ